jgi:hypothetical protein
MISFFNSNRLARCLSLLFICALKSSCITYVYPSGGWAEPLDLKLHSSSLEGVVVDFRCEKANSGSRLSSRASEPSIVGPCPMLRKSLKNMGAQVLGLESDPESGQESEQVSLGGETSSTDDASSQGANSLTVADVRVVYTDFVPQSGSCGWILIPLIFTGGLYPCLAETRSKAALTVTTFRTNRSASFPLEVSVRKYFGIGALTFLLSDMGKPLNRSSYQREQGANLVRFIQNKVYTSAMMEGGVY